MKRLKFPLCLVALLSLWACATLDPSTDPLVVRTEQLLDGVTNVFNTVVQADNANRDFFRTNAPTFHSLAESLRQPVLVPGASVPEPWAASIIIGAWNTKQAYKGARTEGNSNALYLAWLTLNSAYTNANNQLTIVATKGFLWPH